jgi:hypothetical protein
MAQIFMQLASLAWLCCCCHHALMVFRSTDSLTATADHDTGRSFAHYR